MCDDFKQVCFEGGLGISLNDFIVYPIIISNLIRLVHIIRYVIQDGLCSFSSCCLSVIQNRFIY